jgi:hypothetical protein
MITTLTSRVFGTKGDSHSNATHSAPFMQSAAPPVQPGHTGMDILYPPFIPRSSGLRLGGGGSKPHLVGWGEGLDPRGGHVAGSGGGLTRQKDNNL